jgi:hypothetical protein
LLSVGAKEYMSDFIKFFQKWRILGSNNAALRAEQAFQTRCSRGDKLK